jgi:RNA binding exosome subunit
MDPLSITTGVLSLLAACVRTGMILKDFYDSAAIADTKVKSLLTEVESFTQVLCLIKETLGQENIQTSFQATGHIGNHLNNLATSIRDGQETLLQLQETIERVNKSVGLLDSARKHLRLRSAADEIAIYQQKIRSSRDTLQLTLQTVIL